MTVKDFRKLLQGSDPNAELVVVLSDENGWLDDAYMQLGVIQMGSRGYVVIVADKPVDVSQISPDN